MYFMVSYHIYQWETFPVLLFSFICNLLKYSWISHKKGFIIYSQFYSCSFIIWLCSIYKTVHFIKIQNSLYDIQLLYLHNQYIIKVCMLFNYNYLSKYQIIILYMFAIISFYDSHNVFLILEFSRIPISKYTL